MGDVQKFGENAGSTSTVTLIASTQVPAGNIADMTDYSATADGGSVGTVVTLQKSNDNFAANTVNVSRIVLPVDGTFMKTYDSPIRVPTLNWFRVQGIQATLGPFTAEVSGQTVPTQSGKSTKNIID